MVQHAAAAWLQAESGYELAGAFAFGDTPKMADELLAFVQQGTKRATAGAVPTSGIRSKPHRWPSQPLPDG